MNNLRTISVAILIYTQDNNMCLPDCSSPQALFAQINVPDSFTKNPRNGEFYQPNHYLSHKNIERLDSSQEVILYEDTPWSDGRRFAAFLDGHIEYISVERWTEIRRRSGM